MRYRRAPTADDLEPDNSGGCAMVSVKMDRLARTLEALGEPLQPAQTAF
jgi:hypothetical protein